MRAPARRVRRGASRIEELDGAHNFEMEEETSMAKLTTKKRKALKSKDFVFPKTRKFPIEDKAHARDALARAAHKGGAVEAKVRAAVKKKYPGIGKKSGNAARRKTKKR